MQLSRGNQKTWAAVGPIKRFSIFLFDGLTDKPGLWPKVRGNSKVLEHSLLVVLLDFDSVHRLLALGPKSYVFIFIKTTYHYDPRLCALFSK